MKQSKTQAERLAELQNATTDIMCEAQGALPASGGELVRLAHLASGGVTSQAEREAVAIALLQSAQRLGVDSKNLRACAAGLIIRCDSAK